jgi:GAF domain-containing protein
MAEPVPRPQEPVRLENATLYALIEAVAAPSLDRVLAGVVRLLTQATDCHACFVYLRSGEKMRLWAASAMYSHVVGHLEIGLDEGVTGWVARHGRPTFIRDGALNDPRMLYVPELEEEHFQSMAAVPIPSRSGDVLGVIMMHTAAPREFGHEVMTFLQHTASMLGGPIENARLLEQTRRRVERLTTLSKLGEDLASAVGRDELADVVTAGVRRLLGATTGQLYLHDPADGFLRLARSDPPDESSSGDAAEGTAVLLDALRRRAARAPEGDGAGRGHAPGAVVAAPVASGEERIGVLIAVGAPDGPEEHELLRSVAHQLALALGKAELIERLTTENAVRDLFDALAAGEHELADRRAGAVSWRRSDALVVLHGLPIAAPADGEWAARIEVALRRLVAGTLVEIDERSVRALIPIDRAGDERMGSHREPALDALGRAERLAFGLSEPLDGLDGAASGLRQASDAATVSLRLRPDGGLLAYRDLGAYKYLVRLGPDDTPRDRQFDAITQLLDYDRRRHSALVPTLERFLGDRQNASATARALFIHPNTLRQRLARIQELTGLDLASEDLLSLQLAISLSRLEDRGRSS